MAKAPVDPRSIAAERALKMLCPFARSHPTADIEGPTCKAGRCMSWRQTSPEPRKSLLDGSGYCALIPAK